MATGQHGATGEENSRILTSLSTALFFPWPAKRMEMFQIGEPRVEMVGEEQNSSLLKSTELSICEKICSLHSSGGERYEEEGKRKRGRDNEKILVLILMSQVQRMEPKQIFCHTHRVNCEVWLLFQESFAESSHPVPPNKVQRSQERQYPGRCVEGQ